MIELKDIDKALAEYLLEIILKKQGNPSYKEVAEALSVRLGRPINPHYNLSVPLGNVSELCHELGLPLISARVVYSGATTAKNVGEGFYPFACQLKPEYKNMEPVQVWKQELKLIRECSDWSKLQRYLGLTTAAPAPTTTQSPVKVSNPFSDWLSQNTELSESSVGKYSGAVGTISKEMYQKGTIQKPLENMSPFELDLAIALTMSDSDFIAKNTRGNHMYSNALKQYRYFINAVTEDAEDSVYIEAIKNDEQIPETERKAIIQSRVGQGTFRKSLFEKYQGRCIVTGIDHPKLLVASHIKPWSVSSNKERLSVDNGLLLSATYVTHTSKTGKVSLAERMHFEDLVSFLYVDFFKGMAVGNLPRRCQNCKKFFLALGAYDTLYCNEIAPGETKRTCRMVGAHKKEKLKTRSKPTLREYSRVYNRLKARKRNGLITTEQWNEQVSYIQDLKEKALKGILSEAQLKAIYDQI